MRQHIIRQMPTVAAKILAEMVKDTAYSVRPKEIWEVFDSHPDFDRPEHLKPYIELLGRAMNEELRFCVSTPPQHGKTTAALIALVFYALAHPGKTHLYVTYNQLRATDVQRDFKRLLKQLSIDYKNFANKVFIVDKRSKMETIVMFSSITGSVTGYSVTGVAILDDVVKGNDAATSLVQRDNAWAFLTKELITRENERMSIICIATRWDRDDVIGRLCSNGFQYVNIPILCIDAENDPAGRKTLGEPLWVGKHSKEQIERTRATIGEATFYAMYMGDPFPKGAHVFEQPTMWQTEWSETDQISVSYGMDLGYSGKGDFSVLVKLEKNKRTGQIRLIKVIRRQCKTPEFIALVLAEIEKDPAPVTFFCSGIEKGIVDLVRERIPQMQALNAVRSKLYRSAECAEAWNAGKIAVPHTQDIHCTALIKECLDFTGNDDPHDDCVDALAGAYELFRKSRAYQNHFHAGELSETFKKSAGGKEVLGRIYVGNSATDHERTI